MLEGNHEGFIKKNLTSDDLGLHIGFPAFQTFKNFSQEYSDFFVLVARLICSFIVSAGTSSTVFYVYYYCLLESENNLCTFHMKTLLSSPFCLINTVLACLVTSPVSDSNVIYKWRKKCVNFYIPTLANQVLHGKRAW